jgi:glycosyltransferase involved in cell wall biosynthesis
VKGLSLARHELIWVAETDDAADRRFLSHILPAFGRDDVMAAFGRITCIDREGAARSDLEGYFDGLENFSWASSVIVPAFKAFTKDFSIKNVIPNASGLVFRKPHLTKHETERLFQYRFAGDWYFYSLFARGGAIAYQRRARSFFRVNPSSASRSSFFTDRHLLEHQMIIHDLRDQYGISDAAVTAHIDALSQFFTDQSPEVLHDTFLRQEAAAPLAPPLRICIAANGFAVGGGEILPVELANHLKATGCHVTYLVVEKSGVRAKGQIRQRLRNDIPVVYWDDVRGKIAQFIEDFGIQVINSHNVSFDYRLYLDKVELSIPYVASLHGGYETVPELMTPDFLGYLSNLVTRWLYLSTKNISFLSASANDKLVQSFNAVPSFEGEWVDRSAFRREHAIAQDAFVFVQCSRAIEAKGWRMSIEIVEQLAASVERPVHLVLIGDGPIAASLKADYASSRFVTFLGQVDLPVRYFKCFDMGLFPSTYEGETFPLFLLECFSAGLPVISTDIGEIPRILQRVDGLTPGLAMDHRQSPSGLREAFAKELALVMRNERTYDDLVGGAKAAAARFSMSELVSLYESVFREALSAQAVTGVDVPCLAVK